VFEDIFYDNRDDAEQVLGRLMETVAEFDVATLGDLYSMVGLTTNYTHESYGWDDLSGCTVHYSTNGYVIDLPDVIYLN